MDSQVDLLTHTFTMKGSHVAGLFNFRPMVYKGESTSNQPNLFPVEIHLFFFDVVAL